MTKVTMNLTDQDVQNAEKLTAALQSRSKAATVSAALSITSTIADIVTEGGALMIHNPDGSVERLIITGLKHGK